MSEPGEGSAVQPELSWHGPRSWAQSEARSAFGSLNHKNISEVQRGNWDWRLSPWSDSISRALLGSTDAVGSSCQTSGKRPWEWGWNPKFYKLWKGLNIMSNTAFELPALPACSVYFSSLEHVLGVLQLFLKHFLILLFLLKIIVHFSQEFHCHEWPRAVPRVLQVFVSKLETTHKLSECDF